MLVGATTENPFFALNAPLLSRSTLWRFEALTPADLRELADACAARRGVRGRRRTRSSRLVDLAEGDARAVLTTSRWRWPSHGVEPGRTAAQPARRLAGCPRSRWKTSRRARETRAFRHGREEHYDLIAALIKSLRGSDPDAGLYWLARLLEAGEDPRFVARRLVILASEDVGMADPARARRSPTAAAAGRRVRRAAGGGPEPRPGGRAPRAGPEVEPVPRSGWWAAQADVRERPLGAGAAGAARRALPRGRRHSGTAWATSILTMTRGGSSKPSYLPAELVGRRYYEPSEHGAETGARRALAGDGASERRRRATSPGKSDEREEENGEARGERGPAAQHVHQFFVERGQLALPAGEPGAQRPLDAVHDRRHGAVQAVLPRRGAAARAAGDDGPAVRAHRRHRRHRHDVASRDVLRDARELQLRRLLQGAGDRLRVGAVHRGARPRPRAALGHGPRLRRRGRRASGSDVPGLLAGRIQRLGEDNFWKMGETGPCGPCSEIFFDRGRATGPAAGPPRGGERYVEIWNLVFMQYERHRDGSLTELPRQNIDTGAGLDRILTQLQGVESVFDTDLVAPVLEAAASAAPAGSTAAPRRPTSALRILADHARAMTFLDLRRRLPLERGPRLRAAPPDPPGRARGAALGVPRTRHPGAHRRRDRGHGRGLPEARARPGPRSKRIAAARGGGLPAHAAGRHDAARGGARRRAARLSRATSPSSSTTPTASRST